MTRVLGFLGFVIVLWVVMNLYQSSFSTAITEDSEGRSQPISENVRDRVTAAMLQGEERYSNQLGSE